MPFTRPLSLLCAATLCLAPAFARAALPEKPNIILIYSDDVGLGDVHCTGGPFKTPNIDAMAQGGTRFEYCYATPLCGPSRCETLTGRYPFRTGHNSNGSANAVSPEKEVMIPTVMKKAGYATASAGKWGQICLGPKEWGFDEHIVFKGSGRYWNSQVKTYNVNGEEKPLKDGEYIPDLLHTFAVDFINRHKDGPFFLYYPMSSIHGPILRTPDSKPGAGKDQLYADNIEYMDKLVGKLMAELDRLQLREKTIVIFTGDNGTARFGVEAATVDGKKISGMKASMLEGGSRVPLVVNCPGTTPAGKVNKDLIDFSDFFTTFAHLGGAPLPEGVTLDGHSFAAQIKGEAGTPREWAYVELGGKNYVRDARYKLTGTGELFDLKNAPFEEIPVAATADDAGAIAARAKLEAVLKDHPAKQGDGKGKGKKKGKKAGKAEKKKKKRGQPEAPDPATTGTTTPPAAADASATGKVKGKGKKKQRAAEATAAAAAAATPSTTTPPAATTAPSTTDTPEPARKGKKGGKKKKKGDKPAATTTPAPTATGSDASNK